MASIVERLQESFDLAEKKIGKLSLPQKLFVILDSAWERYVHGANKVDYFQYGFYFKRRPAREQYVTIGKARMFNRACNDRSKASVFAEKAEFIRVFKNFLGRDALDMKHTSFEEFYAFTQKHDRMFIKPQDGTYGKGVDILDCGRGVDIKALFEKLNGQNILVEEVIRQHPEMAQFNDTSLNSMRVVTILRPNGEVDLIPGSVIRVGRKGRVADNFHHNGMGALVDNETGRVCTMGIDKNGKRYVVHPDSGISLLGFKVPLWEEVKKCVCEAAKVVPEVRYVGWDVAITDDNRIVLVEGNDRADPDLSQMSDGIGKWPIFKKYMDEILAAKK